jgi:uncharacterized membrane protein YgcG
MDSSTDSSEDSEAAFSTNGRDVRHRSVREYGSSGSRRRDAEDNYRDAAGLSRPIAKDFLRNVLQEGGTVYSVFHNSVTFQTQRNRRECLALARIIDALYLKKDSRLALELACRRLAGVHTSDRSSDWDFCDAIEQVHDGRGSFLPDAFMKRTVNNVMRTKAINKGAGAGTAPALSGSKAAKKKEPHTSIGYRRGGSSDNRDPGSNHGAAPSSSSKKKSGSSGGRGGSGRQ